MHVKFTKTLQAHAPANRQQSDQ